jgi:hypothetical protein
MWLDGEGQDAVNLFWQRCGEVEPFPRTLERSLALAFPVTLVKLPRLKLREVEGWLQRRGVAFQFGCQSRAVRGCLIAFGGEGLIFVDGADPDDERRFTLAHEIAHFLTDYWQPRQKAILKLGPGAAEVMDGFRPASVNERVQAVLASLPMGVQTDLMERDEGSEANYTGKVWAIENRADRIALALLAPPEAVLAQLDLALPRFEQRQAAVETVLGEQFGLPPAVARAYSRSLLTAVGKGPSWVEAIRG